MRLRVVSLAACALLIELSVPTGRAALADWQVHRPQADITQQLAGALAIHPDRRDLAVRLVKGVSRAHRDLVIRRFQEAAAARPTDFAARLAFAQILLAAGRWQTAADEFAAAADLSPLDVAAKWGRARALAAQAKRREAVAELRAALALSRVPDQTYQLARELTAAAVLAGDVEAELDARRAAVRLRPQAGAVLELAATLNNAGHHDEAAALLSDRAATMARTPEQRARWGLAEGKSRAEGGDLERAGAALAAAARQAPVRAQTLRQEIWGRRVEVARRRGTLDQLAQELAHPRDGVEWMARAQVADEQGDLRGAWSALEEAVHLSPSDVALQRREIAVARRVGSPTEVAALYQRLAATSLGRGGGDDPAALVDALDGLWELGRPQLAGQLFDRVLARRRTVGGRLLRALADTAARWGDDRRAERCWTDLLRGNPADEQARVALGEIQLQRGQRRSALDTWRGVLRGGGAKRSQRAEGHARLAEILADHDFPTEALAEAHAAVELDPSERRFRRLLATTLERQGRLLDAEAEWETVLRLAQGAAGAPERHEARTRLLGLWIRAGTARVDLKLHAMEQELATQQKQHASNPGNTDESTREMLLFVVQAQLRTGRTDAALALMKQVLERPLPGEHADGRGEELPLERRAKPGRDISADADLILLLVRTLRQVHRPDEAMQWLEQLARRFPERAREARLQLADLALAEHADQRAQQYADQAAAGGDGDHRTLLRAAAVQERLGHLEEATLIYRRLLIGENRDTAAALGLAGLLARSGETEEQRTLLEEALRKSDDEEIVTSAGTRAIVLAEASGPRALEALEGLLADTPDLNGDAGPAAARRRLLAAVLWRIVPALYRRRAEDPVAAVKLNRFARHGVRPLLELASAPDSASDTRAIELLGMLGHAEAVPGLARLLVPDVVDGTGEPRGTRSAGGQGLAPRDDLASTIVVALGRLGGELARVTLESFAHRNQSSSRLALLWALGRVGGAVAVQRAQQELTATATDGGIVACLSLGRAGGDTAGPLLLSVARDPSRPLAVREAALLGLGLGHHRSAVPALRELAATADDRLAQASTTSLRLLNQSGCVWGRGGGCGRDRNGNGNGARNGDRKGGGKGDGKGDETSEGDRDRGDAAADEAFADHAVADQPVADEAIAISGGRIDGGALLSALRGAPRDAAWSGHREHSGGGEKENITLPSGAAP